MYEPENETQIIQLLIFDDNFLFTTFVAANERTCVGIFLSSIQPFCSLRQQRNYS